MAATALTAEEVVALEDAVEAIEEACDTIRSILKLNDADGVSQTRSEGAISEDEEESPPEKKARPQTPQPSSSSSSVLPGASLTPPAFERRPWEFGKVYIRSSSGSQPAAHRGPDNAHEGRVPLEDMAHEQHGGFHVAK